MCGFFGAIHKGQLPGVDAGKGAIGCRGKDYYSTGVELGYAHLPTDSNRADPFQERQGSILLYNGIITNVKELRREKGFSKDEQASDTEFLHLALNLLGTGILENLRGMFALALVRKDVVILARDTIGIKPLYYVRSDSSFAFCSEMKGLLSFPGKIQEVSPGEMVSFETTTGLIVKTTFEYRGQGSSKGQNVLSQALIQALVVPTRRYLERYPERKAGLLLSGGVDSTLLLGILKSELPSALFKRVSCYCIGEGSKTSDIIHARTIARKFGARLITVATPHGPMATQRLASLIRLVESGHPRVIKAALLQDALAKTIQADGIEMVISGEGADELFYGYPRFNQLPTLEEMECAYATFFREVFPRTLLQRLDRIFSSHLIEARVPFLDQEVVRISQAMPSSEKITKDRRHCKLPVRKMAAQYGVPPSCVKREKTTMTQGSTGRENGHSETSYLEENIMKVSGQGSSDYMKDLFYKHFGAQAGEHYFRSDENRYLCQP